MADVGVAVKIVVADDHGVLGLASDERLNHAIHLRLRRGGGFKMTHFVFSEAINFS